MSLRPHRVADPEWRKWLGDLPPRPPAEGQIDRFHRQMFGWLRQRPPVEILSPAEAAALIEDLLLLHLRLEDRAQLDIGALEATAATGGITLITAIIGGPIAAIAAAIFGAGAILFVAKKDIDQERRQKMLDEIRSALLDLIEVLRR